MTDYVNPRQPDARFPNRPTHPDFFLLSDTIQELDNDTEHQTLEETLGSVVDVKSLLYIVQGQMARLAPDAPHDKARLSAAMVTGFMLGARYAKTKHQP